MGVRVRHSGSDDRDGTGQETVARLRADESELERGVAAARAEAAGLGSAAREAASTELARRRAAFEAAAGRRLDEARQAAEAEAERERSAAAANLERVAARAVDVVLGRIP